MKRRSRPITAPPNVAAKSLRLFKPKAVAVKKAYSRKIKHPKGSASKDTLPFFILSATHYDFTKSLPFAFPAS
ncbi:MAG TPA: hypothetical protein VIL84_09895 [Devosiaceae bacterium]